MFSIVDLLQDLLGMLAERRRRATHGHRLAERVGHRARRREIVDELRAYPPVVDRHSISAIRLRTQDTGAGEDLATLGRSADRPVLARRIARYRAETFKMPGKLAASGSRPHGETGF